MNTAVEKANASFATDNQKWQAVVQRDRSADGSVVVAVKTTGIYCRPSCSSRRPNRKNVSFFPTCEEAEQAGYRACKRCKPKSPPKVPDAISLVCLLIEESEEPPSLFNVFSRP
jgi:AraC family transcriptional regulator of adaptative response/methylated-DNA-[protein]-cysteine methyltransferase